jgi:chorismate lyase/3-hydroxybenzoate synthase
MTAPVNLGVTETEHMAAPTKLDRLLDVVQGNDCKPASADQNLLLGFQFGTTVPKHDHPAIIKLRLQPLDREELFECWWYKGKVSYESHGPVRIAECGDYSVVIVEKEPIGADGLRAQTREAYLELLQAVGSTQHTHLVKIWNYFGEINSGNNDSEKYRQFSVGRAEAFRELGIHDEDAPTGTAIGTENGSGLVLIALASNRNFSRAENPRQVSAFHYPRQYGPSSPKFARGGLVMSDNHKLFLISGTAAVVGHESNFPYNTPLQIDETFKNLGFLCDAISDLDPDESPFELDENSVLRVYLKNPDEYSAVAEKLNKILKRGNSNIAFLNGTICRRELTVEIDGVKVS